MKKIYFLSLLCCMSVAASAQTSVTLWANGGAGTWKTGNSTAAAKTEDNIVSTSTTQAGYAVFDLSSIPTGSTINTATLGFYLTAIAGGGGSGWNIHGWPGDLSLVGSGGTAAALFADMNGGTAGLYLGTYGTVAGTNVTEPSTVAAANWLNSQIGNKVSLSWTGGGTRTYTIRGESGNTTSTVTANHAPYLTIQYCAPPTLVTATAAPTTVCAGDNITLTASSTGGSSYYWTGPGGFTAVGASVTATGNSTGAFTVTAYRSCGTYSGTATASTAAVTVNPLPAAISGPAVTCTGTSVSLSDATSGGGWGSSDMTVATLDASGNAFGVNAGTATITYTNLTTNCYSTLSFTVNDAPAAIAGPTDVCEGASITLTDAMPLGGWSSSATGTATVDPVTGDVWGVPGGSGTAYINYTIAGCAPATFTVSVDPSPSAISGAAALCQGYTSVFTDPDGGGTWSSSSSSVASVGAGTGVVTAGSAGVAVITYAFPTGCYNTTSVTVSAIPASITGPTSVCANGGTITVADATPLGSWTSSDLTIASVDPAGLVTGGVVSGVAYITYSLGSGCYVATPITVFPLPSAIAGTFAICQNTSTTLTDIDPGGTWSSSNTAVATIGSSTGAMAGASTGAAVITYTSPTTCYITVPVTILPAPTATITAGGPTTFCAGGSVMLNATAGGTTYQWYTGSTAITGATTSSLTVSATGSFAVQITNGFNCSTMSALTSVSSGINPVIVSSGPNSFCVGNHVILSVNTGGAVGTISYQWALNGAAITGANAVSYYVTQPGIYTASVAVSGGSGTCGAVTAVPTTVVINANPAPSISYNGVLLSTANIYSTYQWYINTISIPGATSYNYRPIVNGSYRVVVSDGNNCSGNSGAFDIVTAGVSQINSFDVYIYPNPANNMLHVNAPVGVRATITGMEGRILLDIAGAKDIDISRLPGGMYLVSLYNESGEKLLIQKLIKE